MMLSSFFTGLSPLVSALPWAGLIGLIGLIYRAQIPLRKIKTDADASLRTDLLRQLTEQESAHKAELAIYDAKLLRLEDRLEEQRKSYESKLDYERVSHAGEMASFRHKVANLEQSLNMLLALVENNPERAGDAATKVRQMREKQEFAEAAEKTAITAAKITATSPNL